jgi:hypothetical protein
MIQGSEDGSVGCHEITRKMHDGVAEINTCGNGNMKKNAIPVKQRPAILLLYLV